MSKFIDFSAYNNHQAFLISGRLVFNAKEDNIFIISKKDIALSSGGDVHINVGTKGSTTAKFIVNSPIVQMGLGSSDKPVEAVAKGDSAVSSIETLLSELSKLTSALSTCKGIVSGGIATLPSMNAAADAFSKSLPAIKKSLDKIKSQTTFTS